MRLAVMLLGCLLFGSTSDGHAAPATDIVAKAMTLPSGSAIAGSPVTLVAALGATADRGRQLQIVHAYWQLAQAVAEYRFCFDHTYALARIKTVANNDPSLRLAAASAAAQLHEAELAALDRQYKLAELLQSPVAAPLPLPADRPYADAYRTGFNEMFAGRTPPESARLADKLLPLQRQAIDARAAAVQAADDAIVAATDDCQSGRGTRPPSQHAAASDSASSVRLSSRSATTTAASPTMPC